MTFDEELEVKGFGMDLGEELIKAGAKVTETGEIDFDSFFTDLEMYEILKPLGFELKDEYKYLEEELKAKKEREIHEQLHQKGISKRNIRYLC